MSKIVQAINAMIINKKLISNATSDGGSMIFFSYKDYTWSIAAGSHSDYCLAYYPNREQPKFLANLNNYEWEQVALVNYWLSDIRSHEAKTSFSELHTLLTEKIHGVDKVLDDIISDTDDAPF